MSLRLRLAFAFAAATAAILAVVGVGFLLQLRTSLDATLDTELRVRAETLVDEYQAVGLGALRLTRDEEPVQVLTADGRVIASSPSAGTTPVLDAAARRDVVTRAGAGARPLSFTTGTGDDDRVRYLAESLDDRTGTLLVVGYGTDTADVADEHVDLGLTVLGPPAVLLAGLAAWLLAGAALRPVERMRRQAAALSARDGGHLPVPGTRDEIARLATTMNDLLDRLRAALEHERGFVADAGHELRTPLATLRAELELAARPGRTADDLRAAVAGASEETERLVRLTEDLLLLARVEGERQAHRAEPTDLTVLAAASARAAAALAERRGVDVVVEGGAPAVEVDPDEMRRALDNLVANAVRHSPDHGVVLVELGAEYGTAFVSVSDTGPGFPPDFLPHAFERFRRADGARARADGGSGLGLAIVDTIARAHGGHAAARNRPEGGAEVTVWLPCAVVARSGFPPPGPRAMLP